MGRSCLGCQENISTGQMCLSGEMFSRLPRKVSRCDVDFVKCKAHHVVLNPTFELLINTTMLF